MNTVRCLSCNIDTTFFTDASRSIRSTWAWVRTASREPKRISHDNRKENRVHLLWSWILYARYSARLRLRGSNNVMVQKVGYSAVSRANLRKLMRGVARTSTPFASSACESLIMIVLAAFNTNGDTGRSYGKSLRQHDWTDCVEEGTTTPRGGRMYKGFSIYNKFEYVLFLPVYSESLDPGAISAYSRTTACANTKSAQQTKLP
jgi:hypothetical protein